MAGIRSTQAQAPAVLWRTNIGAQLFAVDDQTNLYANINGTVITLNSAGQRVATNFLNSASGIVRRDASGNFYFLGLNAGTNVLFQVSSGFQTNYAFGAFLIAKYSGDGSLIWSNNFGPLSTTLHSVDDLQIGADGSAYAGVDPYFRGNMHSASLYKFSSSGSNVWSIPSVPGSTQPSDFASQYYVAGPTMRLGIIGGTNGFAIVYGSASDVLRSVLSYFDSNGGSSVLLASGLQASSGLPAVYSTPIGDSLGDVYDVEGTNTGSMNPPPPVLVKRTPGAAIIWLNTVTAVAATVGPDLYGGVHVSDSSANLYRYDANGSQVWTLALSAPCSILLLDNSGNRFISLTDGSIARLGSENLLKPTINHPLQATTVFSGSDLSLTVGADGSAPLNYLWYSGSGYLTTTTNGTLDLGPASPAQGGQYSVIVSNSLGTITNGPVQVRVKSVEIFAGNQILSGGNYTFSNAPVLSVQSTFTNGSIYYTLDGSAPDFTANYYSQPFTLTQSATVRAIGYSSDFSQSEEADPVYATVLSNYTLTATSSGGGTVMLSPPGSNYVASTMVTATATPASGWQFFYWQGDASGTNPVISVTMNRNQSINAVFGTTLQTSINGFGQVALYPPGGLYDYGRTVRVTGVPRFGSYFGAWGNAASGNTNPLYFTVTAPNPTVSAIFGILSSNQAALTVFITGHGTVQVNPRANIYTTNTPVTLTATPGAGETFLNWSGGASGTQNPLPVVMDQSKIITANFSGRPSLSLPPSTGGFGPGGFQFMFSSDPDSVYQIYESSNLINWTSLGYVTNLSGQIQFTDPGATNAGHRYYRSGP